MKIVTDYKKSFEMIFRHKYIIDIL